ncbi:hypothetical protein SAMN05216429_106128 [Marinobacter persicus]|uniref:Uncharacterized protein n=1 Tax=Marinobacter persicus TaxID=930118 RepID=A0A1I3UHQ6_9GAMM|nr:DUF5455 family protein [Marinobacter persicus]GHD52508.1 hypothetical protein GCM10008110_25400 [Marinobacter persicus]SFJ82395.1 hypothetical protein SAMN05216429_106128 [Marinobacter persicus]
MALLGIPWLAGILGTALTGLIAFFGKFLTKKLAIVAAVITAAVSLTGAFLVTIEGIMAGIYYAMPTTGNWFAFLPGNFSACVSAIVTAEIVRWVYDWNIKIIQWKLF